MSNTLPAKPDPRKMTRRQVEGARARIQVSKIIDRLQASFFGDLKNDRTGEYVELTKDQLFSAKILLDKSLPHLTSTEITEVKEEKSYQDLKNQLNAIVAANPTLLEDLISARDDDHANRSAITVQGYEEQKTPVEDSEQPPDDAGIVV